MKRLIIRSHIEDIKGFLNLVNRRIETINKAESTPLPREYGVNKLSSSLHPKELKLIISSVDKLNNDIKIITFRSSSANQLPLFRAGQHLSLKHNSFSDNFYILSSPNKEEYKIAVFSDSQDYISKFLFNASPNDKIISTAPEGLFYYTALRDKKNVVAICDSRGISAVISMANSIMVGIENYNLRIIYVDNNYPFKSLLKDFDVEYVTNLSQIKIDSANCSLFISGCYDFCQNISHKYSKEFNAGQIRLNIVNPPQTADTDFKEFNCTLHYRDKTFNFVSNSCETLLSAFEKNNIPSQSKCKTGECGYCRCQLISGEIETKNCADIDSRRSADIKYNYIHPCRAFAKSDLVLSL